MCRSPDDRRGRCLGGPHGGGWRRAGHAGGRAGRRRLRPGGAADGRRPGRSTSPGGRGGRPGRPSRRRARPRDRPGGAAGAGPGPAGQGARHLGRNHRATTYPERLRLLELPPPVLFVRGDPSSLDPDRSVAVVGTRRASERGRRVAGAIGGALASAGALVVSGLALGIDGAAHAAAVGTGGRTVAVLGAGHERLYPRHIAPRGPIVAGGGAIVTELAPDMRPVRARSRAGTGSSAASPMRPSSSRPASGAGP